MHACPDSCSSLTAAAPRCLRLHRGTRRETQRQSHDAGAGRRGVRGSRGADRSAPTDCWRTRMRSACRSRSAASSAALRSRKASACARARSWPKSSRRKSMRRSSRRARRHEKARRDLERGERLYADKVISLEQLQDLRTQTAMAEAGVELRASSTGTTPRSSRRTMARCCAGSRRNASWSQPAHPVLVLGAQDQGFRGSRRARRSRDRAGQTRRCRADPPRCAARRRTERQSHRSRQRRGPGQRHVPASKSARSGRPAAQERPGREAHDRAVRRRAQASASMCRSLPSSKATVATRASSCSTSEHARRRDVEVAFIEGERSRSTGGIDAGEQVITDGAQYLEDGEARRRIAEPVAANPGVSSDAAESSHELSRISDPALPVHAGGVCVLVALGVSSFMQHSAPGRSLLHDLGLPDRRRIRAPSRRTSSGWWSSRSRIASASSTT